MIAYEWKAELLDEHGDIININHFDTYAEAKAFRFDEPGKIEICLVRDVGNDVEGLTDRQHAYVEDGVLGDMENGAHIPARFRAEVK